MSKQKRLSKWGNSVGVRIPKSVLGMTGMEVEDDIDINCVQLDNGEQGILITGKGGGGVAKNSDDLYNKLENIEKILKERNN